MKVCIKRVLFYPLPQQPYLFFRLSQRLFEFCLRREELVL